MKFGGTDRRRLARVGALIGAFVAVAVAFGVVQASATPGAGIVGGPIVARGPVAQDVVIGVPQTVAVTRTVRVRVGKKVVRKRVTFQVETVRRLMSCASAAPCDIAFQQLTISPGGTPIRVRRWWRWPRAKGRSTTRCPGAPPTSTPPEAASSSRRRRCTTSGTREPDRSSCTRCTTSRPGHRTRVSASTRRSPGTARMFPSRKGLAMCRTKWFVTSW